MNSQVCLVLTENTLEKNLNLIEKYRNYITAAELRADFLDAEEMPHIRSFPERTHLPIILTIRRVQDGGLFAGSEDARMKLFADALSFSDKKSHTAFAYIDVESDIDTTYPEDMAQICGTGIIRSRHSSKPIADIVQEIKKIRRTEKEIVKIAYKAETLSDTAAAFRQAPLCGGAYCIVAMGTYGFLSRILAPRIGSAFVYTMPEDYITKYGKQKELIDPITLENCYRFSMINNTTKLYGVAGGDTSNSLSPAIHNGGFRKKGIDAVYVLLSASRADDIIDFAAAARFSGLSITNPFKCSIIPFLDILDDSAKNCGAVNTVCFSHRLKGYNTDMYGIQRALQTFLNTTDLQLRPVAVIGTGGAARAAAAAVQLLRGTACIFGRNAEKAQQLAEQYEFAWSVLDSSAVEQLTSYSSLIIQTTSAGMLDDTDPLAFYPFSGTEWVFDVIYTPDKTPLLKRAEQAGCKIANGYTMLCYQAYKQFELFTGEVYE